MQIDNKYEIIRLWASHVFRIQLFEFLPGGIMSSVLIQLRIDSISSSDLYYE